VEKKDDKKIPTPKILVRLSKSWGEKNERQTQKALKSQRKKNSDRNKINDYGNPRFRTKKEQ
jgi:hypothetical protein